MTVTNLSTYAGTCQVWGYVFDDQDGDHTYDAGEGISGHLSKIYNQSYTFTDPDGRGANGKYIVFAPTPATYTLLASASGYGTATRSITLSSSQMSKREDFELQPLPAGSAASFENDNASIPQLPEHAIQMLGDIKGQILSLDPAVFKTPDRREALIKQYDTAIRNIQEGRNDLALKKIQYGILMRTNGCNRLGLADDNDWITDCEVQKLVYDSTAEVKELVK